MKPNFIVNREPRDYATIAADAILDLLQREHAAVWPEIEAKLAERPHPLLPHGINPHHLTNARRRLIGSAGRGLPMAQRCACWKLPRNTHRFSWRR